jgi:hypothetical protein
MYALVNVARRVSKKRLPAANLVPKEYFVRSVFESSVRGQACRFNLKVLAKISARCK